MFYGAPQRRPDLRRRRLVVDPLPEAVPLAVGPRRLSSQRPKVDAVDPTFDISAEKVGANATLLVERLVQARVSISSLHATLLAIGIHEDTNSLTYGGSRARTDQTLRRSVARGRSPGSQRARHASAAAAMRISIESA